MTDQLIVRVSNPANNGRIITNFPTTNFPNLYISVNMTYTTIDGYWEQYAAQENMILETFHVVKVSNFLNIFLVTVKDWCPILQV